MQNKTLLIGDIEKIILRRIFEKRLEGYTIETAREIFDTVVGHQIRGQLDKEEKWK
jgi:hypothetical protein